MIYINISTDSSRVVKGRHFFNSSNVKEIRPYVPEISTAKNEDVIDKIQSFGKLKTNWDSYGAVVPSENVIRRAVNFVLELSIRGIEVYFTAPSPDGEIVVELKKNKASLEFEFVPTGKDSVAALYEDEEKATEEINDTTIASYLKWLICPDGNCPPRI